MDIYRTDKVDVVRAKLKLVPGNPSDENIWKDFYVRQSARNCLTRADQR